MERFSYHGENDFLQIYPFRFGDVVEVKDWGCCYSGWFDANILFTKSKKSPFYNEFWAKRKGGILFKIKKIARHPNPIRPVIFYLEDREKKGVIIDGEGIKLVKQYPLRKNEKKDIEINTIIRSK
jgi:hypothetical protein